MSKINLGIIFGGNSSEHKISLMSTNAILNNISRDKYNIFLIGITRQGKWFLYTGNESDILDGDWDKTQCRKKAFISPDTSVGGLIVYDDNETETIELDVVIPVLHGKNGEDGTVQGLLELAKIPFVGCDTTSSAICMDKIITNSLLVHNKISKPNFHWFYSYDFEKNPDKCIEETEKILRKYPLFVKPANSGSSLGISKVRDRKELINGIQLASHEDNRILIEESINARELECSVIGNNEPFASVVGEIVPANDFYDYDAKYDNENSKLFVPACIPEDISNEIRNIAIKAYKILGCTGLARVDFLLEKGTNKIFMNELNTFPGFTSISMYPKLMEKSGIKFPELIDKLVELAISKK